MALRHLRAAVLKTIGTLNQVKNGCYGYEARLLIRVKIC